MMVNMEKYNCLQRMTGNIYEENRIISDTHGLLRPEIIEILKDCDCIIHAGDVNKPEILDTLRMMGSIYVVRGNNDKDWAEGIAKTLYFTIEGVKFFMTHNKKDVDWDPKRYTDSNLRTHP